MAAVLQRIQTATTWATRVSSQAMAERSRSIKSSTRGERRFSTERPWENRGSRIITEKMKWLEEWTEGPVGVASLIAALAIACALTMFAHLMAKE